MAGRKKELLEELDGRMKLTSQELAIMDFIWNSSGDVCSKDIYEQLPFSRNNISTVLHHISEKGYLENYQKGLHHFYRPLITRAEYKRAVLRQQMKELNTGTSFVQLVSAFYGREALTEQQKQKIEELLEVFENDNRDRNLVH